MQRTIVSLFTISFLAVAGCAAVAPHELVDARNAYQHASASRASDLTPADLHQAKEALEKAELAFRDAPKDVRTLDLSYVAQRKAQLAEALAAIQLDSQQKGLAEQSSTQSEHAIQRQTQGELNQTREQLAEAARNGKAQGVALDAEKQGRIDADKRAADAESRAKASQDALTKLAMVKDEARGMVITLSGSVLFASDQATLLPEAQTKLAQVADALMSTKERNIVVEGYTDSRGSASHNLDLSQRRADAVRTFIISRGYEADKMQARGIGKESPVASNANAEGRANNRRVEIVVERASK